MEQTNKCESKYERLRRIGVGSYGIVFKCVNRQTGQIVAIKRYSESDEKDPVIRKIAMREVRVLRQLKHPNLINLIEVFRRKRRLHLVFDYCELTVLDVIEKYGNGCPLNLIRKIVWQIVNGTSYCHTRNCIHRDIKPENILINQSGVVKLCDFGFARTIEKPPSANQHTTQNESLNGSNGTLWNSKENVLNIDDTEPDSTIADRRALTEYVATRWYRAPELLIGEIYYDAKIDIWAIGCVTAELMRGEPIWPGKTDLDQLFIIKNSLGSLTPVQTSTLINRGVYDQVNIDRLLESGQSTAETVERKLPPRVGDSGIDFVSTCLQMDPERRPTCEQLLRHEYIHSARMAQFMKTANSSSLGSAQLPGSGRATILAPISEGEPTRATSDQPIRQQALDIQKQRANSQSLLVSTSKSQTPAQTVPGSRRLYTVGPKQIQNHHNTWSGFNGLGAKNKRVKQPDYDSATSRKDIDQTSKSPSRLINKTEPRSMVPVAKVRSKSDGSSLSVGGIVAFAPTKSESNRAELGNDNFRKQTKRQHNDLEKTPTEIDSGSYFSLNKQDFSSFSDRLMKSTLEREKSEIPRRANNSKSMHRETDNKAYFGGIRLDQQANVKKTIKTTGKSTICTDSSASSTVSDSNKSISQLPSVFNRLNNQQIVKSSKQVDQLPFSAGSPTKTLAMPGNLPKASNKLVPIAM